VTLDTDVKTINIASSTATNTIASLVDASATALNISGDAALVVTSQTLAAAAVITSTSSAAVTLSAAIAAGQTYTGGAGADTVTTTTGNTKAITTGAGDDVITYGGPTGTGGSIAAGDGTDTLVLTAAQAVTATGSSTFAATVSGLETFSLSAITGAAAAINMANADGVNSLTTKGASSGVLAISNAAEGFTLTSTALSSTNTTISLLSDLGTADTVNLVFAATNGFTDGSTTKTIANVENIVITTNDTDTTAATTAFTSIITATSAVSVTISGDAGFNATGLTATTLTSFDAAGVTATGTGGAVTITTGALAAAATLTGGAGTNTIDAGAATKAVTITGGAGLDALSGGDGADVINGGDGGTTGVGLVGGAGADTITGGSGTDTITGGAGADTLTGGAKADTFIFTTAGGISTATSMDVITDLTVGSTGDSITLVNKGTEVGVTAGVLTATISDVSLAGTIIEALNLVSTADGGTTNAVINWFQFGGDTYLVQDLSASTSFVSGVDQVIKLTGLVDLDGATSATTDNLLITFA